MDGRAAGRRSGSLLVADTTPVSAEVASAALLDAWRILQEIAALDLRREARDRARSYRRLGVRCTVNIRSATPDIVATVLRQDASPEVVNIV